VIAAREFGEHRLLNIRNPWGSFEWGGDWCDSSKLWTKEVKAAINPVLDQEDGQFWMSYSDFLQRFNSVVFCKVRKWQEVRLRGAFVRTSTADNLQLVTAKSNYEFEVHTHTQTLILGLH